MKVNETGEHSFCFNIPLNVVSVGAERSKIFAFLMKIVMRDNGGSGVSYLLNGEGGWGRSPPPRGG
jgi:hypothetical protein